MTSRSDDFNNDPADPNTSQAALDKALDDLEAVLKREHGLPEVPAGAETDSKPKPGQCMEDDGQYKIPLLSDVVMPGAMELSALDQTQGPDLFVPPPAPPRLAEDAACRHVVRRLASELDVIIQSGVDEALREAKKRIMRKIKDHIEITLPEILDEIDQNRGTGAARPETDYGDAD